MFTCICHLEGEVDFMFLLYNTHVTRDTCLVTVFRSITKYIIYYILIKVQQLCLHRIIHHHPSPRSPLHFINNRIILPYTAFTCITRLLLCRYQDFFLLSYLYEEVLLKMEKC